MTEDEARKIKYKIESSLDALAETLHAFAIKATHSLDVIEEVLTAYIDQEKTDETSKTRTDYYPSRWIPITERLPEEFKTVYVTIELCGKVSTDFDRYDMTINKWQGWGNKVTAWMPLPEPYKP